MLMMYLASPYTHKLAKVRHQRFIDVTRVAAKFVNAGFAVVAPITTSVPMAKYGNLKHTNWDYWKHNDLEFLHCCDTLVVLKLAGWEESVGVKAEIAEADRMGIQIHFVEFEDKAIDRLIDLLKINEQHLVPPFRTGLKK